MQTLEQPYDLPVQGFTFVFMKTYSGITSSHCDQLLYTCTITKALILTLKMRRNHKQMIDYGLVPRR